MAVDSELASPLAVSAVAKAIFDLSRGRQALLSVTQPALGALLALGAVPSARILVLGLVAATTGFLAVFSLNDVLDRRSDEHAVRAADGVTRSEGFDLDTAYERHPIATGVLPMRIALVWVISLAAISAVTAYALAPPCLVCLAAAAGLEIVYCSLRSVTWAKTFVSGAMVGVGGLAGWFAVAGLSRSALSFFAFLAAWEIAGRNLPNDLADLQDDSRVGLTTVSTVFGHEVAQRAIYAGAVLTAITALLLPGSPLVGPMAALVVVWLMVQPSARLAQGHPSMGAAELAAAEYFNRASLVPAVVFVIAFVSVLVPHALF